APAAGLAGVPAPAWHAVADRAGALRRGRRLLLARRPVRGSRARPLAPETGRGLTPRPVPRRQNGAGHVQWSGAPGQWTTGRIRTGGVRTSCHPHTTDGAACLRRGEIHDEPDRPPHAVEPRP